MKRLTAEHLCKRIPYGVICNVQELGESAYNAKLLGVRADNRALFMDYDSPTWFSLKEDIVKPILFPLSSLTKEMIEKMYEGVAEGIVVISKYDSVPNQLTITATYKMMGETYTDFICSRNKCELTDYWIVKKLLELHFDIDGLIPDLAIDVTTLDVNPYK